MDAKSLIYQFDDVRVDLGTFRVTKADSPVQLEPKALELLVFMIENRGRLIEKKELLDAVWGDAFVTENAMTRVIAQLRKALADDRNDPRYIETVPTRGYRFIAEVEQKEPREFEAREIKLPKSTSSPQPGQVISHYQIVRAIGRGGMGEVYLAEDLKLGRRVTIKFLASDSTADGRGERRLVKEARAAAMLDHTNICAIHEVGEEDGRSFIVMQFIDGESLASRVRRGPLSLAEAIDVAIQVADALNHAHSRGIIHRDIKPKNLMLTPAGQVKVLDFGLAKVVRREPSTESEADTESLLTTPGVMVGTMPYMSPEQVRGESVDDRSDIFSLGTLLYELIAGSQPFAATSAAETISAILTREPLPLSHYMQGVPEELELILRSALAKDRRERYQAITDFAADLKKVRQEVSVVPLLEPDITAHVESKESHVDSGSVGGSDVNGRAEISRSSFAGGNQKDRLQSVRDAAFDLAGLAEYSGTASTVPKAATGKTKSWRRLAWIVPCVLLLAALPFVVAYFQRAPAEMRVLKLSVSAPEKTTLGSSAISPDGRRLVFVATADGKNSLWVRPLDSLASQALPGTDDARHPFWSPDSRFLGFFAEGKLKRIEVSGGPATTLCDVVDPRGGTWSRDGVIVFAPNLTGALYRVSTAGAAATPATKLDPSGQENSHRWPHFLPDGRHFVFFVRSAQREVQGIYVGSLDAQERKRLVSESSSVAYALSGHLLFVREGTLLAQPFDLQRLSFTGEALPIAEQVRVYNTANADFSVSGNGVLAYRRSSVVNRQLIWFDRRGNQLGAIAVPSDFVGIRLSPDEKRVAGIQVDTQTRAGDIWLVDLSRGGASRFTSHPSYEWRPVWSPDGSRIVFGTNRDGPLDLYLKALSGSGQDEALLKSDTQKNPNDWSRDGQFILYDNLDQKTNKLDLWALPLAGDREPFPLMQTEFDEQQG
jgi:serine/threonine protein kinase/Tol biopolymer transport system component